ncbi:MAG: winged helix-turn-helix transcriptional regulator [Alphaproteobacteria bacterium]|nr:winged helix-turn-helix transcriptional regulator [Alphaproteobacteria bacterium]
MSPQKILFYAELLKAIANPHRLKILYILKEKENNVGELEQKINLSQSALSQHLAVLRNKDIVKTRRSAQTIYYTLKDKRISQILELLNKL